MTERTVQINCYSCDGRGVYIGWAEAPVGDLGVVCVNCKGSGADMISESLLHPAHSYVRYTGRLPVPEEITRIQLEMGGRMGYNPDPVTIISYADFLQQYKAADVIAG